MADVSAGPITANDLRWLAEKADGLREQHLALVTNDDGKLDVIKRDQLKPGQPVILDVETPDEGPGIPGDAKIRIEHRGVMYGAGTTLDQADAVFVTQSAVEKFVLPYYMRFKSGAQVQALQNMLFRDPLVICAPHIPPSLTLKFPNNGDPSRPINDVVSEIGTVTVMKIEPKTKQPTFIQV